MKSPLVNSSRGRATACLLALLCASTVQANVTLPALISDHMVLQKRDGVNIWGKADPGEDVTVTLDGKSASAKAGADGKWSVKLNLKDSAQGPFEMTIKGKNEIRIADVVVGEVWVAGGQSNMQMALRDSQGGKEEMALPENPLLRQFKVELATANDPLEECKGEWVVAGPKTLGEFTGIGYFFAKDLSKALKQPVGLINSTRGGTHVEAWTSAASLSTDPDLKTAAENQQRAARDYPANKAAFATDFEAWLKATNREDKPAKVEEFAGPDAGDGWVTVKIAGPVAAAGLPKTGAIWVRKEFDVPAGKGNTPLVFNLGDVEGAFETVYLNGKEVATMTHKDYPGSHYMRNIDIPADLVKEGKNVLAIRLFAPFKTPSLLNKVIKIGTYPLKGDWQAKAEFELPPLEGAAKPPEILAAPISDAGVASSLFNGMISPLLPYTIAGVIWYQGEGNATRAQQYRTSFALLINDWRKQWNQPDLPFYFCQLTNYMEKKPEPGEANWAELRDSQNAALKLPHTGQAVMIDLGESAGIHPIMKKEGGERLAKIALAKKYGQNIPYSGPVFESMKIENGKAHLKFTHTDGGLVAKPLPATYAVYLPKNETAPLVRNSPNSELEGFAICGEDRKWVWANAKIEGDSVIVWADTVPQPVAVRYGWADNPTVNLYNGADIPASPFRTDDFPGLSVRKYK